MSIYALNVATGILQWVLWSQVSQANLAMVRMVGMGRGDLLVFLDSPVYQGLPVQLVRMVTATLLPATSRQGPPTSLWMWKDLQGTESHFGRDRKTVGLTPLSTQGFSRYLTRSCGWWGAFDPLTSSLVSMFCADHISSRSSQPLQFVGKQNIFLCWKKSKLVCFFYPRDVLIFSERCAHISETIWNDQTCSFIPLSLYPCLYFSSWVSPFIMFSEIKAPPHSQTQLHIITQSKSASGKFWFKCLVQFMQTC